MSYVVAVDPGSVAGGACLLDERGLPVAWWAWQRVQRQGQPAYALTSSSWAGQEEKRNLAQVGQGLFVDVLSITVERPYDLVCEGLFVHKRFAAETAITLGKAVGWLTGSLLLDARSYEEARASTWRPVALGCASNASSDLAEALAGQLWRARWTGEPCESPHVWEAYSLGWWRHTTRRS